MIRGSQTIGEPELPDLAGGTLRLLGAMRDIVVPGRRERTLTLALTPAAPGALVIPPIAVQVDGEVLRTQELRLEVRPSDAADYVSVEITAGRQRLYVGQRVRLTLTIWIKPPRFGQQVVAPEQMLQQIRALDFGPFPRQVARIAQRPRPGSDENYYAYEFLADFVLERPGRLTFDDIEVAVQYPTRGGVRDLHARAQVEPAEVLPPPEEGRPAGFQGAVGLLSIETTATPTRVHVGDPIELTIDVFGGGPIETLPPPRLDQNAQLTQGFRVPAEPLTGELHEARRRFKLVIRATRDDVSEIPPIEYPHFDPDAERYFTPRSKPIPLEVLPAAEVALTPSTLAANNPAARDAALEALDGLHDIETRPDVLLASRTPLSRGVILTALVVPPALFAGTWAATALRRSRTTDTARRRRQAALRTARRRLAAARRLSERDIGREVLAILAGYLADRADEPPGRFLGRGGVEYLRERGVPEPLLRRFDDVVAQCEAASFAGSAPADGAALCSAALASLTEVERRKP
ncbi:MAG: BatD family protein [Planctomycetota bacterium]